jgi:CCR4-NOT transcription complex subunit 1
MNGTASIALELPRDQEDLYSTEIVTDFIQEMAQDAAARAQGNPAGPANAIAEAGPACTSSQATLRELLRDYGPVDEAGAARIFATVARLHGGKVDLADETSSQASLASALANLSLAADASPWKLDVITACLASDLAKMNVERLAEQLDHDAFELPDSRAFVLLMKCWRAAMQEKPFPLAAVIQRRWSNVQGQLAFLRFATAAPPQIFTFEHSQRKLAPVEGLQVCV